MATTSLDDKFIVYIMGGPGSGKGTQCARLKEEFNLAHLSSGDLLRAEVAKGTPEGEKIHEYIKEGKLVPQEVVIELMKKAIEEAPQKGIILDGFPRSVSQLEEFERTVKPAKFAIYFECSEDEMLKRIMSRAASVPEHQRRADDNPETAMKRFKTYTEDAKPTIARLREEGTLHEIDAMRTIDEVYADAKKLFL